MKRTLTVLALAVLLGLALMPVSAAPKGEGDPKILAMMHRINEQLAAQGLNIAVEEIELYTIGWGRPSNRIHQSGHRWVAYDPFRGADGDNITYLVDQTYGATASGLSGAQTEAAIDRAMTTWDEIKCLKKVDLVKRSDPGLGVTVFDWDIEYPGSDGPGDPFIADIVHAGWWPRDYFEWVFGPGGGRSVLGFSVTYIFGYYDADGNFIPSDMNGDNYLDTALNEIYWNDTFGDPGDDRVGNPWGIDQDLPGVDVETVSLHEVGHSLGIGHFGPPPVALMNPYYAGINQEPDSIDQAGMCAVWASWPK